MDTVFDPTRVYDSTEAPGFKLGQVAWNGRDGTAWMFLEADAAIDPMDVVIVHLDGGASQLTTTTGAVGTGVGKNLAVAPESPSQAIAQGDFFWGCVFAPAVAGIKFNAVASVEDWEDLYASTTAGHLTDVFDADQLVVGIHSAEADDVEPVGVIIWPFLMDTTNA